MLQIRASYDNLFSEQVSIQLFHPWLKNQLLVTKLHTSSHTIKHPSGNHTLNVHLAALLFQKYSSLSLKGRRENALQHIGACSVRLLNWSDYSLKKLLLFCWTQTWDCWHISSGQVNMWPKLWELALFLTSNNSNDNDSNYYYWLSVVDVTN